MTNGPKGPDFFGMTEKELFAVLKKEQKKTRKLAEQATLELHRWSNQFKTLSVKPAKIALDKTGFDQFSKLVAAIEAERAKQANIKRTIDRIKTGNLSLNQIKGFDLIKDTSNIDMTKGEGAQDKYARVMENVSNAADIREEWDSTDVLKIDDIAIEQSISYDKAKEIVEKQKDKGTPAEEVLGEGDDEI